MAEPTGTARQEAERLVATVLAMASGAGLGGPPKEPGAAPSTGLGDMITGLVDQFFGTNPTPGDRQGPDRQGADRQGADRQDADPEAASAQGADRQGSDRQDADRQDAERAGTDGQAAGRERAGSTGSAGSHGSAGHRADERGRGGGQQERGSPGAGGLGGVWQFAGRQLWEDVGRRNGWSTGSAECCVCPICKAIAGMRDPSPERAERLAAGAGDFASGMASMLRAFSVMTGSTGTAKPRKPPARPTATPDQAWSAATRTTGPADRTPAEREVREGDDPWTAATRAPQPAEARATAPVDATSRAAAQADAQTDATGGAAAPTDDATGGAAAPTDAARSRDPWGAATRTPPRTRPTGSAARLATPEGPQPAAERAGSTHQEPTLDPAAAVEEAAARTGKTGTPQPGPSRSEGLADNGPGRVTGATDVWAAATAANGDTAGDTGVADTPSVDHDVPGTAPAAEAAEGRGAGSGDDARAGDAV